MSEILLLLLPLLWAGSPAEDKLTVPESVTVQESLCVFVPCTFSLRSLYKPPTSPVYGYWFREGADFINGPAVVTNNRGRNVQEATRGRFHLLGDPLTYNCSLDIRDAKMTDNGVYIFRVESGRHVKHSYTKNRLSVHVTTLNHTPDVLFPRTLESGRPSNLTCSVPWACERGTPPIFSWMSAAHISLGPRILFSSVITLTPRPQDHGTNLTCQVYFPEAGVTVERTAQLNVTCASKNPTGVCPGDGTERPEMGAVLGAVKGAGVTALLAVCLCLIYFMVKTRRKRVARTTVGVDNVHMAIGPASPVSDVGISAWSPPSAFPGSPEEVQVRQPH
ncbi:myeloid cell surface antigen CD33-like isoform X2 [Saccopteryx bilineata]|uniref:myeloid cell surface antigen CD33-like isoform X2 n=1 Tax=Saccopteryx bilineata TaxID=59482 RepID=UPI00338DF984